MERFATGLWLERGPIRLAALGFLALTLGLVADGFVRSTGTHDQWGRPLGTDFSGIYAAGRLALEGRAGGVYDWAVHRAAQAALQGDPETPFFPWHYPPVFLLIAAPLALLPYLPALFAWQLGSLAALLWVVRRILPDRDTLLVALGCPVVFVCAAHGQNGFLTAALFGGGLLCLPRRPLLAGFLLGCLCYKPQLGLAIPVALVAGGHWRAIAGAAVAVAVLCAASTLAFGPEIWPAFWASLPETRRVTIEESGTGWYKLVSVFAYIRLVSGSFATAAAVQGVATVTALAGLAWLWRTKPAFPLRAAGLILAALLSTPYVIDYDLTVLGPAIAFLAAHGLRSGFGRWEATLLAVAWLIPLVSRHLSFFSHTPGAVLAVAALFASTLSRAAPDRVAAAPGILAVP